MAKEAKVDLIKLPVQLLEKIEETYLYHFDLEARLRGLDKGVLGVGGGSGGVRAGSVRGRDEEEEEEEEEEDPLVTQAERELRAAEELLLLLSEEEP